MKINCGVTMGIGDELCVTALVREYKRAFPLEEVHVHNSKREWIWKGNPYLGYGVTASNREYRPNTYAFAGASTAHGLAKGLGLEIVDDTPEIFLTKEERDQDFGIRNWDRTVAIDIQAMWASRQWDPVRFIRVAELLRDDGWRVIEVGHRGDKNHPLMKFQLPADYSFLNQLEPRDNCALLSKVSLYLGMDSGSMHMAAAVGTPQVAIFGPIKWYSRAYWNTTPVFAYSDCAKGCMEMCSRQEKPPYGPVIHCLDEIKPERVAEAARVAYNRYVEPGLRISRPRAGRSRPMAPIGEPAVEW